LPQELFAAVKLEEAHLDAPEEEWQKWEKWYDSGSASYLYCQLRYLSVQHL